MTTLTQSPLAPLLERLFQEANAVSPLSIPWVAALSPEERTAILSDADTIGWLHHEVWCRPRQVNA